MIDDEGSDPPCDLDPERVFSVNPEYVSAAFDDQVVLAHLNHGKTISLSATAGMILDLLDGCRTTAEIREQLQSVDPASSQDLDDTLRYLLQHGALDVTHQAADPAGDVS